MKDIPGYENEYAITKNGKVYSYKSNKFLKSFYNTNSRSKPYLRIALSKNGKSKKWLIHRLVALTYISNKSGMSQVNHIDGNYLNNNVNNLEWSNNSLNQSHAYKMSLNKPTINENHPLCKLTNNQVIEIKKLLKQGHKHRDIAKIYNVSKSLITGINTGKNRKYL